MWSIMVLHNNDSDLDLELVDDLPKVLNNWN